MKPCNITCRSLIIARLSESNKTTAQIESVEYLVSACIISLFFAVDTILVYKPSKRSKEKSSFMLQNMLVQRQPCLQYQSSSHTFSTSGQISGGAAFPVTGNTSDGTYCAQHSRATVSSPFTKGRTVHDIFNIY
jgi:hypothetical protein